MPSLSVLVPVYNEERTLTRVMASIVDALPDSQIVYIDDGSRDSSLKILKENARPQDKVLTKQNGGKGSAIRLGLEHANGDYGVIQDADLEYDPREIKELLTYAETHPDTAVFGSRFLRRNPNIYPLYLLGNKFLTLVINLLFWSNLTDSYTCIKLFPMALFRSFPLKARGFELEAELCAYPLKRGIVIHELPISYRPRSFAEGKKIRWQDAWKGIMTAASIRFRS
jgi:glycosyltransferase involved in cell wall biosynthesis